MKKAWFWGITLCVSLLTVSVARAEVVVILEQPAEGQTGVGLDELRGLAYDTGGKDVTVRLRLDGVTFNNIILSCCDLRQDNAVEPDSGFSASINYGTLFTSPGPHLVGVEVSAEGEDTVVVDNAVVVLKPGNATFVTGFDLSTASCSIQGNQIVINDAMITSSGGSPVSTDLTAGFATNSQSLVFTSASPGIPATTNFIANINTSQEVPTPTSTTATGSGTLVLNRGTSTVTSCSFTFSNLTGPATAAHIHIAPPGVAGPVIFPLILGAGSGSPATCTAGQTLTADQVTALDQGNLYFNVHTVANEAGEARGQLVAAPPAP